MGPADAADVGGSSITDLTRDTGANIHGPGEMTRAIQTIGDGSAATVIEEQRAHSNRVISRWLIRRHVMASYPGAAEAVDWKDPRFRGED
jgi:type III restriction enzyme